MSQWKLPPVIKVYEALSAVADGRVRLAGERIATVESSGHDRIYKVTWSPDRTAFASDDNGSKFQGYLGYPIIATLLVLGDLPLDSDQAAKLSGVPWREINDRFKRNYELAIEHVLEKIDQPESLRAAVNRICDGIASGNFMRYSPSRKK